MQHGQDRPNVRSYECPHAAAFPEGHAGPGHSVVADSLEDGVLRVLRHVLKEPPAPVSRPVRKKVTRDVPKVQQEIDILVDMRIKQIITEEIYTKKYEALRTELAGLEQADSSDNGIDLRETALQIGHESENVTQAQLRQLVLLLVHRVEAPVVVPGVFVRGKGTGLRRHAVVHLHLADSDGVTAWNVPLYLPRYNATKEPPFPFVDSTTK